MLQVLKPFLRTAVLTLFQAFELLLAVSAIKEVANKDFDRGYWVQTEIDILTLPLEQKQVIRNFRDQNQKEGNFFEPGTIVNQFAESTGKSFEGGAKK